jgi:hypothetical protein
MNSQSGQGNFAADAMYNARITSGEESEVAFNNPAARSCPTISVIA